MPNPCPTHAKPMPNPCPTHAHEQTKQELARVVVRYMLFATRAKPGVPVARGKLTDAIKKALGNQRHHRK